MSNFPLVPPRASNIAGEYDALFYTLTAMTAFFTLLIAATIVAFVIRFRRRQADDVGIAIGNHYGLEITWTVIPLLICLVIFVWSSSLFLRWTKPPDDALVIQVVGKQWMWKLQHPNGRKEINELHVPLGRPVHLIMTSQDVIHSFFVPAFRVKHDVVPGQYAQEWFIPTQLGEYHLFCARYCGGLHSQMEGRVVVMAPGDYDRWAANAAPDDRPEAAGGRLFAEYGCMACHGQQAPTLAGIYGHEQTMQDGTRVTVDDAYLRESILAPRAKIVAGFQPIMPSYEGQLSEEQLFEIMAYIKSLAVPAGNPPAPLPNTPLQVPQPGDSR